MAEDSITFNCTECGAPLTINDDNPPADDDVYRCPGCGREIGKFGEMKEAMHQAAKDHLDKMIEDRFGKKPDWS